VRLQLGGQVREADFETWAQGIVAAARQFPGHLAASVLDDPGSREYHILFSFADAGACAPGSTPRSAATRSTIQVAAAQASDPPGLLVDRFGVAVGRGGVGPGTPLTRVRRRARGEIGRHGTGTRMPQ
jgi:hypothetical protein